ncbi:oxidoreductase CipA-like protein [Melanomma pulvis-pyrius CBS 109.77]|uniref:Oxidoreductase CipA-like protein n=1 Tax=Melanomma pulvis-pyrius CBS 109.77 TaxID=1314802 RepID=A0A6A6XJK9_9PLEO|nr:oxidoreductase CipA-like protein [Melanomma pulvis-pyrius CBS 109.77]
MPSTRIALAGATGNLGVPILKAFLAADFHVTVLSRTGGNSSRLRPNPNLTIKEVDFDSVESLTPALQGVQVVVSSLATLAIGTQNALIDASVAAGVTRFIPAEFGMDSRNPLCVQLPVCAPKAATQNYLRDMSNAHPGFTYTCIANGLFLDWGLEMGIIADLARHTATLYNGGDVPFSATNLGDVAKAVLGVVGRRGETANRVVYVHSALVTQNRLIQYAKDKDGKEWNTVAKDTEEVKRESFVELAKGLHGDVEAAMLGFCICASWNADYGCDFSGHLDNELLGVKELDEAELRGLVESFL